MSIIPPARTIRKFFWNHVLQGGVGRGTQGRNMSWGQGTTHTGPGVAACGAAGLRGLERFIQARCHSPVVLWGRLLLLALAFLGAFALLLLLLLLLLALLLLLLLGSWRHGACGPWHMARRGAREGR
jgi:hypothetical protein